MQTKKDTPFGGNSMADANQQEIAGGARSTPPKHLRLMEGEMEKEVLSRDGLKFHKRVAMMTEDALCFTRVVHPSQAAIASTLAQSETKSVWELRQVFNKYDSDENGVLDIQEATSCLIELEMYTTAEDISVLFQALDVDQSGFLDWEEFVVLARQASASNIVADYIPLHEIEGITYDLVAVVTAEHRFAGCTAEAGQLVADASFRNSIPKSMQDKRRRGDDNSEDSDEFDRYNESTYATCRELVVNSYRRMEGWIENVTGLDFDGDGNIGADWLVEDYDKERYEFHLILSTSADGFNSGRTYVLRVSPDMAQEWFKNIHQCVRQAKEKNKATRLVEKYGSSRYSMIRAITHKVYLSNGFQYATASVIIVAFILDMVEAEMLPDKGTTQFRQIFLADCIITGLFTVELCVNIFVHSNHGFRPFYLRASSWFDVVIVVVSLFNVILTASGEDFPNAKMMRMLRLGRAVRLFHSLKDLNRLITAISNAMYPVCNAFLILFITSCVYGILGTNFFRRKEPEYFADFHTSLFTMFQVGAYSRALLSRSCLFSCI